MTNNINVTLDTSVTPNVLDVDDKDGNYKVNKHTNPQTISWNLTGNLAQAEFVSMCGNSPGFEWVSDPPPSAGIFGEPEIGANGNSLDLVDTHSNGDSDGTWIYRLRVLLDGTVYQTTSSAGVSDVRNNPIIINQ
jgi:hypothetical protein